MATKKKKSFWNIADLVEGDKVVWIIVLILILFSIVCMFSSSSRLLKEGMTRVDLVWSQFKIVFVGLIIIIICYSIKNINIFRWFSKFGFLFSLLLLGLLDARVSNPLVRAIQINDAYRILAVGGIQIHVFEVVKIAMVMYLAWAIDALKKGEIKKPDKEIYRQIIYLYAPFLITFMLIIPGSNSSAVIIGALMFIVILLGGGTAKHMFILAFSGILLLSLCVGIYYASDKKVFKRFGTAVSRITEDKNWEKQVIESPRGTVEYQEALDKIMQPYSARIAIHEGGFIGKGPGQSTQRYVVPDISEDYMFSFIIEEYGLLGGLLVIALYLSLLARGSIIVRNCGNDLYAKLSVAGLCLLITGQAFLHMFVNAGIGPMTGQTLPLISHGNSAFICFSLAFGIILSFSRIAAKRIEKETDSAEPILEMHENVKAGLDELDAFESGQMDNDIDNIGGNDNV